jgi:hypothetical protein
VPAYRLSDTYSVPPAGLSFITSTSFSSVTSFSVDNCFTATYDNYRVIIDCTLSIAEYVLLRFRAAGADNTSSNYTFGLYGINIGSATLERVDSATTTFVRLHYSDDADRAFIVFDVMGPALTEKTSTTGSSSGARMLAHGSRMTVTTAYDGFTVTSATSSLTGKAYVYGYRLS